MGKLWSGYAPVYDRMSRLNPAYQALQDRVRQDLGRIPVPPEGEVADLGAGTGNFSVIAAEVLPDKPVYAVDPSGDMLDICQTKRRDLGLQNLHLSGEGMAEFLERTQSLSLVLAIHSLYVTASPLQHLCKIFRLLEPEGGLIVCDIGRRLSLGDWRRYLAAENKSRLSRRERFSLAWPGLRIAYSNLRISRAQKIGTFWTHSNREFRRLLEGIGFEILECRTAYREYSDYVIAKRPK